MKPVTDSYIDGIKEGREWLRLHGMDDAADVLANVTATARQFDAQSPVGQILRGERDFWRNQLRKGAA